MSVMTPVSRMAFAVSVCAFAAAGVSIVVNHWLTGWMAVGGMAGIGLFYLAIGILNLHSKNAFDDDGLITSISQRRARSDNLYGEAVSHINAAASPEISTNTQVKDR